MAPTPMKLRVRRCGTNNGGSGSGQQEEDQRSRRSSSRNRRKKKTNNTRSMQAAVSSPPASSSTTQAPLASEEASPDSKCPICLDRFNNMAYLDRCLHRFCFPCIQEWSHNKAECPLCKQPFASILHSVRGHDDFKEYTLRPVPPSGSVAATVAMVAAMASAARNDQQMRLLLRRHRVADGTESTARRRRREEERGVWEWYLDVPPLSLSPHDADADGEQRLRGSANLVEHGVIFEGLSGLGGPGAGSRPNDRASRRLMTRLSARLRLQREGGVLRRLREREAVAFRRALYRCSIRVHGVAGIGRTEGQRDITVESFRRDPAQLNRLRPWLRRELTVLYGAHSSLVDFVQNIIMARLARHGLEDTPTIEEELRPFLLSRTEHFLHELVSFARSPLTLDSYDLQAVYEPPPGAMELDASSGGSANSSIIAISEGEEADEGNHHDDVLPERSCLSLSAWDDETPGPSYSTAEALSPGPQEAANEEEGECMIVGYKKPMAERTPELVQLSSDTEGEEPQKTSPLSSLPTIPPSTSAAIKAKDIEMAEACFSGSGSSVCTLSPSPPAADSTRRRRRKRRGRGPSGISANPNRCIYPAMMCSPLRSSLESTSPLPASVADSASEYCSSQDSCLTTSSSSSPCSSPMPTSPLTPSCSHREKPGGKRKYKSRHLDRQTDPSWKPRGRRSKRRRRGRSEISRRSPSVEIVYEGTAPTGATHKRYHKTQQHNRPPPIITLDSDSSPPSGQHDNSEHLPPLSLVHLASLGTTTTAADIGELPVDILDGGSDRSEEPSFHEGSTDVNDGCGKEGQPVTDTGGPIGEPVSKQTNAAFCNTTDDLPVTSMNTFGGHNQERPPSLHLPEPASFSSPPPLRRAPPRKDVAPPLVGTEDSVSVQFSADLSPPPMSLTDVFSHLNYLHEGRSGAHDGDLDSSSSFPVNGAAAGSDLSASPAPPSLFDSHCLSPPSPSATPPTTSAACHVSTTCDL
uniref:E3 ubiquitin-protein ligase Topors-like isoform X2 n=1 Tax=Doryrhamphus excisus TaxID=161450 RepID=UPI0025AE74CB|nr:E3 ubiquitin-protein ligase Topors-like isoform X2 [Doryrhamphus excisus]